MRNILNRLLLTLSLFLFYRCAVVVPPSGGPKDSTPPKMEAATPVNYSTNFNAKSIDISFDEFVKLNNISEQLIVTPSLKEKPEVKIKGKGIIIDFKDTLKANTTYTFNFGDAIQDITEGNKAGGLKYVFSTGSFIDSSFITGYVYDAFTKKPVDKAWVLLYTHNIDSLPLSTMADYVTKTTVNGAFKFENLKKGVYKIVALLDKNGNFMFDQPSESIAFSDTLVSTSDSLHGPSIPLYMFQEEPKRLLLIKKSAVQYGKVLFVFNKNAGKIEIKDISNKAKDPDWYIPEISKNKDSLTLWIRPSANDSLNMVIYSNGKIVDTANIALISKEKGNASGRKNMVKFSAQPLFSAQSFDLNNPLMLSFSAPLKNIDETKISLLKGKDVQIMPSIELDSLKRKISVKNNWVENTDYTLTCLPGAFQNMLDLTNDTLIYKIKTRELQYYAQLTLNIQPDSLAKCSYILQLLNEKDGVVYQSIVSGATKLVIPYLAPGKYRLRAICDFNSNGKWDVGSYIAKQHAEPVIYNKDEIMLRSNWEIEVSWSIKE